MRNIVMFVLILQFFFTAFAVLTLWLLFDMSGFDEPIVNGLWRICFIDSRANIIDTYDCCVVLTLSFLMIFASWIPFFEHPQFLFVCVKPGIDVDLYHNCFDVHC